MITGLIVSGLFGLFAGGLAAFSGASRAAEEQAEIAARAEEERRMREARVAELKAKAERDINYAKLAFKKEQEDALTRAGDIFKQGERIDEMADLDETLTGRAFNLAIKKDNIQDKQMLMAEQRGKQNFENQQGGLKANLGMSGVRSGSSTSELLLEQNKTNFNQDLSVMQDQRKTEREINLLSAWHNLRGGMVNIDDKRNAANIAFRDSARLRADYSDGGRVVNLFNTQIANRRADLEGNINLINIGGEIQQDVMQRAYERAEYTFLDGFTDFFTGGMRGMQLGNSLMTFANKWSMPTQPMHSTITQYSPFNFNNQQWRDLARKGGVYG